MTDVTFVGWHRFRDRTIGRPLADMGRLRACCAPILQLLQSYTASLKTAPNHTKSETSANDRLNCRPMRFCTENGGFPPSDHAPPLRRLAAASYSHALLLQPAQARVAAMEIVRPGLRVASMAITQPDHTQRSGGNRPSPASTGTTSLLMTTRASRTASKRSLSGYSPCALP
jgi:hypothetical protein